MFARTGRRATLALALALGLAMTFSATASASAAPGSARSTSVAGSWNDPDPLTQTATQRGPVVVLAYSGASRWTGDLTGSTGFRGRAIVTRSGTIVGPLQETFTGELAGVGSGTLQLSELLRQDANTGAITIDAAVTGGTGAFAKVRGSLHFVGVTDAEGVGGGSYTGVLRSTR